MRYSLRTLLIVVSLAAVLAAIAGPVLNAYRPMVIGQSADGKRAMKQLSVASQVGVEIYVDGTDLVCNLSSESRKKLLAWLRRAVRDNRPAKRTMLGHIQLESPNGDNWTVLEINRDEVSIQTSDGTWRGLDRAEFERIARECAIRP